MSRAPPKGRLPRERQAQRQLRQRIAPCLYPKSELSAASLINFSISFQNLCLFLASAISFTKQGMCVWERQAGELNTEPRAWNLWS